MTSKLASALGGVALTAVLAGSLAGCSGGSAGDIAADPSLSPTDTATPSPTDEPTVGTYPAYPHDDYAFTVVVGCFCPDAGTPIRITVSDGVATTAEWVRPDGHGGRAVPDYWAGLTMADVIDLANETDAYQVTVEWPEGQDHPDSVWVDRDQHMADEELGYTVSDVVVG